VTGDRRGAVGRLDPPVGPAPDPADIVLLREIRDELRKKA
jgi:hypothetical protein